MPIYSDIYNSYFGAIPNPYSSSTYSLPPYSSPSYSSPSYSSLNYAPSYSSSNYSPSYTPSSSRIISGGSRYLPKLTTISETPLTRQRLAALTRVASPKSINRQISPKYTAPRPRNIDTSQIDVSAQRFANRGISDVKPRDITEPIQEIQREASVEDVPIQGRSTIRRDRALVRLKTTHLKSKSKSPPPVVEAVEKKKIEEKAEVKVEEKEKSVDIDMGYGSSERSSSGSWRNMFEGELDLYDRKVTSPTAKTPGENFFEKYRIKESENDDKIHYLTLDDIPMENRESVRRRSGPKMPSFKEICSDISSDKLTDDLNAGDLRRRASLIIEEEINKIRQSESGTMLCTLESQVPIDDADGDRRKSRKVKKIRQKITAKTSIENPEPQIKAVIGNVEIEETAFAVKPPSISVVVELSEIENKTFKIPLRKKKKLTDVEAKITCDPIMSPQAPTTPGAAEMTPIVEEAIAEIKANEKLEAIVNIKTKNADLDSKLLLDKDDEAPGELKKSKKLVKPKASVQVEAVVAPNMNPIRKDPSVDDFWGVLGSRETAVFSRRRKLANDMRQKTIEILKDDDETADKEILISSDKTKTAVAETPSALDLNSKVHAAKTIENKSDPLGAIADKAEAATNKLNVSEKLEVASSVRAAKVSEPKAEQKPEENVRKSHKSDAPKADKVSKASASLNENKKINENISPKQQEEEKPLKLQAVPKPSKLNLATQKTEKVDEKIEKVDVKIESPKTPPWKLKKVEENLPESPKTPKSPSWKKETKETKPVKVLAESALKIEAKDVQSGKQKTGDKLEAITTRVIKDEVQSAKSDAQVVQKEPKILAAKVPVKDQLEKQQKDLSDLCDKLKAAKTEVKPEPLKKPATSKLASPEPKVAKTVETPPTKKVSVKSKDKIPDTKQTSSLIAPKVTKTADQKMSSDDKSKASIGKLKEPKAESKTETKSVKLTVADKLHKATSPKVNDQADEISIDKKKKLPQDTREGQKLAKEEAKVLNETKNTQTHVDSDEPKLVNSNSKKSLGTLSKFPTLTNLNDLKSGDVNDLIGDKQQQHFDESSNENKAIESDQTIAKASQIEAQAISVATESTKTSTPKVEAKEDSSESESEESSYESESDEMEVKKPFDPQKKVKLDFSILQKCYGGKDNKPILHLVARPRPLWKIKRNRHAVFTDSESGSSAEEEEGTKSTGSSQSSTHSEKPKKKPGKKDDDENITALMGAVSVQEENEGDESELKKKNRLSSSSADSGIGCAGATAAKSPRKAMGEFDESAKMTGLPQF